MADDRSNRGAQDVSRVDVFDGYDVRCWTEYWGVTVAELKAAVEKVGVSAHAVASELGRRF